MPEPRSRRRRRERQTAGGAPGVPSLFRRADLVLTGGLLAAGLLILGIVAVVLWLTGDSSDEPDVTTEVIFSPSNADEIAIEKLARDAIEVLPRGEWPSLYDSFTADYQQRCTREAFAAAGEASAVELGENLQLLRYKRLEDVEVEADSATAVLVGEVEGGSEYSLRAVFKKQGDAWKLAPAENTSGCEAFERISG